MPLVSQNSLKTVWSKFDSYPSKYPNWVPHLGTQYFQLTHKNILSKKENFTSITCGSSTVKFWCRNCGNIENNVKYGLLSKHLLCIHFNKNSNMAIENTQTNNKFYKKIQ